MNFNQLHKEIHELTEPEADYVSFFIHTPEGNIKLNESKQRKSASVAKLFILAEAYRQVEQGKLHLDESIPIVVDNLSGGSGVISYLTNPPNLSYQHLLELMMIVSDNTASNILLERIGMENINNFTKQIGCLQSRINRYFMDTQAQANGFDNYTSAKDMVQLLYLFMEKNNFISDTSRNHILTILSNQQFHDKLPKYGMAHNQISFLNKTGELEGVEHDVAIINGKDKMIAAAVLTEGLETGGNGYNYIPEIGRLLIDYINK